MGQRESRLDKQDKKNQRQFALAVGLLFMNTQSNEQLYQKLNSINREVRNSLVDLEEEAIDQANLDTEEFTKFTAQPKNNKVRRAATAMGVVATVVFTIETYLQQEKEYHQAVQLALAESEAKMKLVATTEFFTKYNEQFGNNLAKLKGYWVWNAQLDKRTCARCSGMSGRQWNNHDDVPEIPLHPRCRCILDFYPE